MQKKRCFLLRICRCKAVLEPTEFNKEKISMHAIKKGDRWNGRLFLLKQIGN